MHACVYVRTCVCGHFLFFTAGKVSAVTMSSDLVSPEHCSQGKYRDVAFTLLVTFSFIQWLRCTLAVCVSLFKDTVFNTFRSSASLNS